MSTQTKTKKTAPKPKAPPAKKEPADEQPQPIPDREIKQNAGVSASMALQAGQKAWELRQAAHGAGDAKAREAILAKAVNKEIEAESFGKAAKYTQSGTFQGLAAGAGLGVKPGVTLGKVTGAIVGGTVSTVTGLLGGGIGSVYGAMNGPMWDLGEMAAHGVQGVVGDWLPDWAATDSQKKALEKMVMQTKETQAPSKEELEQMKAEAPDEMPHEWYSDMRSYIPSMPKMPKMPNMPSMKGVGAGLGLGGMGASMFGGQKKVEPQQQIPSKSKSSNAQTPQTQSKPTTRSQTAAPKAQDATGPKTAPTPREPAKAKQLLTPESSPSADDTSGKSSAKKSPTRKSSTTTSKQASSPAKATTNVKSGQAKAASPNAHQTKRPQPETKSPPKETAVPSEQRKKPRKLDSKPAATKSPKPAAPQPVKKAPKKLERRIVTAG